MVREMMLDALGYDPYEVEGERARVPAELEPLLPERLDLRALEAAEIPLERFGRHWSAMILHGTRRLASLPAENVMHLGYERLVADPRGQLARLAEFLRLPEPPPGWLDAASERVRARPPAWPSLPSDERRRLERACAPGQRRLQTLAAA
jgi:putative sulfotransferase